VADIYDWSTTAADNDDADATINWAEAQTPGSVNNSARAMMKRVAELLDDIGGVGTVGGTADAITLTSAIGALAAGKVVAFKAGGANTGAATLNVNSLGAKAIRHKGDTALAASAMLENGIYICRYDTAYNAAAGAWVLLNPEPSSTTTPASTTVAGVIEIATSAEYRTKTDTTRGLGVAETWGAAAEVTLTDAATIAVDMATFLNAKVTLGGNRALGQPTNTTVGQCGVIRIIQDGTGSRTLSYGSDWKFASGTDPVLTTTASATDLLFYQVIAANVIYGTLVKAIA
jgi:hypothetical protein